MKTKTILIKLIAVITITVLVFQSCKKDEEKTNQLPIANFSSDPTGGSAPLTVNFTDQSTNNPTSWQWDFGGCGTSTQQNPSHSYKNGGTYTVELTVTNDYGSDVKTRTDYIVVSGDTFTDPRDNQTYNTVVIGEQEWFAENLNYDTSNSWCYDNNSSNCDEYGRLYNWSAATTACPEGWHLPTDDEWKALEIFLGMSQSEADRVGWRGIDEGEKMKSTSGWYNNGNGTNCSAFNALPGGLRYSSGSFDGLDHYGIWWSSTGHIGSGALDRYLSNDGTQVFRGGDDETLGFSLRCIKN